MYKVCIGCKNLKQNTLTGQWVCTAKNQLANFTLTDCQNKG